jgi:hypothetical protein
VSLRSQIQALLDVTHQLLVAAAAGELAECEALARRRDSALTELVRMRFTSFARPAERAVLANIARASAEIERRLAARLADVAAELQEVRAARAALPRARARSRSHGRV